MVTLRQGKLLKEIASDDAVFSIQCCKNGQISSPSTSRRRSI